MQCSRCGQVNAEAATVCVRCGQALLPAPAVSSAVPPSAPNPSPPVALSSPSVSPGIPFQAPRPLPAVTDPPNAQTADKNASQPPLASLIFTCRLCGRPVPGNRACCALCGAPHGMISNPGDATGATYIPIGMLYPSSTDRFEAAVSRPVPPQIAAFRWNWGAFGASTLWLLAHRLFGWAAITLVLTLLTGLAYFGPLYLLIPASGVLISLLMGFQGHTLAWQYGRLAKDGDPLEKFLHGERRWKWIGILGSLAKAAVLIALVSEALKHG